MSFEDELKLIKNRAGVTEAGEVVSLGAHRAEKEREKVSGEKDALRQELMQLLKEKETLMAQLNTAVVKYIVRSAMLIIKEDPELMREMGVDDERDALKIILQDEKYINGQVEAAILNLEDSIRFGLKNWN